MRIRNAEISRYETRVEAERSRRWSIVDTSRPRECNRSIQREERGKEKEKGSDSDERLSRTGG